MSTSEERMQILRMVEKGQITAEEGAKLLEAIEAAGSKEQAKSTGSPSRWFRVRVTDMHTGKAKVNVNIPMGLVNVGLRLGAKFAPEVSGVQMEDIVSAVKEGVTGKMVDVEDEERGERVEVYVE